MSHQDDIPSQLSPHLAFVVQFRSDVSLETGRLVGRVEHVVSGHAAHFTSLETLWAFMARVLADLRQAPGEGDISS